MDSLLDQHDHGRRRSLVFPFFNPLSRRYHIILIFLGRCKFDDTKYMAQAVYDNHPLQEYLEGSCAPMMTMVHAGRRHRRFRIILRVFLHSRSICYLTG